MIDLETEKGEGSKEEKKRKREGRGRETDQDYSPKYKQNTEYELRKSDFIFLVMLFYSFHAFHINIIKCVIYDRKKCLNTNPIENSLFYIFQITNYRENEDEF